MKYNITVLPKTPKLIDELKQSGICLDYYATRIGWVYISDDWVKPLSEVFNNRKVLEIMAGTGALSVALQSHGVDIIATDDMSWDRHRKKVKGSEVHAMDAVEAIQKYNNVDYILMAWPPNGSLIASAALQAMRTYNPTAKMVYIGDLWGGATATDLFLDSAILKRIHTVPPYKRIAQQNNGYVYLIS